MLIRLLPFILCLISSVLFGHVAVTENEPTALAEGIVNVITGDLYALEDDIIVQGSEPLRLKRSYISANGGEGWRFSEHYVAFLLPQVGILHVNEPNGTTLAYHYTVRNHD